MMFLRSVGRVSTTDSEDTSIDSGARDAIYDMSNCDRKILNGNDRGVAFFKWLSGDWQVLTVGDGYSRAAVSFALKLA